jgi:hypothetical protein
MIEICLPNQCLTKQILNEKLLSITGVTEDGSNQDIGLL